MAYGTIEIRTPDGWIEVNVVDPTDSRLDYPVLEANTGDGWGCLPVVDASEADTPLEVKTADGWKGIRRQLPTSTGGGDGGDGGGGTQTDPTQPPADRAEQHGLTINNTVTVTSMADIDGADNTLYIVDGNNGALSHNGKHALGTVNDVAICGKNDAVLSIPAGFRDWSLTTSGGSGFLWSGIDLDQTADGAWGRLAINTSTNGIIEFVKTLGKGRLADPDPSADPYGGTSGTTISIPATSTSGTNYIRNVSFVHGGVFPDQHYGDRPIGVFLAGDHAGTLRIVRSNFEEFPNNGLYATNTTGSVICSDTTFWNNGVTNGRIAFGEFINCTHGFDYTDTGMMNADAPEHAANGISVEDKGHGTDVDITNCSIEMVNVASCGGGIVTNDFGDGPGAFDRIEETDVHIYNAQDAPDINIRAGSVNEIVNCVFSGEADSGASVNNDGPAVAVGGNEFSYPSGRAHYSGAIE